MLLGSPAKLEKQNLRFFVLSFGSSFMQGFHPSDTLGSTRELNGARPVLSARLY